MVQLASTVLLALLAASTEAHRRYEHRNFGYDMHAHHKRQLSPTGGADPIGTAPYPAGNATAAGATATGATTATDFTTVSTQTSVLTSYVTVLPVPSASASASASAAAQGAAPGAPGDSGSPGGQPQCPAPSTVTVTVAAPTITVTVPAPAPPVTGAAGGSTTTLTTYLNSTTSFTSVATQFVPAPSPSPSPSPSTTPSAAAQPAPQAPPATPPQDQPAPQPAAPVPSSSSTTSSAAPTTTAAAGAGSPPAPAAPYVAPATPNTGASGSNVKAKGKDDSAPAPPAYNAPAPAPSSSAAAGASTPSTASPGISGGKRGVGYDDASLLGSFSGSGVSWAHNWHMKTDKMGLEFVPTLKEAAGLDSFESDCNAAIAGGAKALFTFNEPDMTTGGGGSAMSPEQAAQAYKEKVSPFAGKIKLGSPSVTSHNATTGATGGPSGMFWLQKFADACAGGCHVDFVNLHFYGGPDDSGATTAEIFKKYVGDAKAQVKQIFGQDLPVWVTEFSATPLPDQGGMQKNMDFLSADNGVLSYLDSTCERYAFFLAKEGSLVSGSGLSDLGKKYGA